jgi:ribosomal protein S18 acetylase RimI-like enzyme
MPVVYFKRFRMQIDLTRPDTRYGDWLPAVSNDVIADRNRNGVRTEKEEGVHYLAWSDKFLGQHSVAKWESFRLEIDANVFPCLGDRDGCRQLKRDISQRSNFVPEATWLAMHISSADLETPAGTIQGLRLNATDGAIQNIGVAPAFRGQGIGKRMVALALNGFRSVGCKRVSLEVTVHNTGAIRLYESIGFEYAETVFKVGNVVVD